MAALSGFLIAPLVDLTHWVTFNCYPRVALCDTDFLTPLPANGSGYTSSYSGLTAVLKKLDGEFLDHRITSIILDAPEINNKQVKTAYGSSGADSNYIIIRRRSGSILSSADDDADYDRRGVQHLYNMLVLDSFSARASYARYVSEIIGPHQPDEPGLV